MAKFSWKRLYPSFRSGIYSVLWYLFIFCVTDSIDLCCTVFYTNYHMICLHLNQHLMLHNFDKPICFVWDGCSYLVNYFNQSFHANFCSSPKRKIIKLHSLPSVGIYRYYIQWSKTELLFGNIYQTNNYCIPDIKTFIFLFYVIVQCTLMLIIVTLN